MKYSTIEIRKRATTAWLSGQSKASVAKAYGIHRTTLYRWGIKKKGKSLERKQNPGSGRPRKLDKGQIQKLTKIILKPATAYGYDTDFWTIRRIVSIAKKHLGVKISKTTMYGILYNEKFSYKKPEKRYYEADKKEQREWIVNIIPMIKDCAHKYRGIIYFEDEANVALDAVLGKTWGPIGKKSIQRCTGNRASVSAMSAISNNGTLIFTLHEKRITTPEVKHFLEQMLKHHPKRHVIVVMDRAKPHTSGVIKEYVASQRRLHVFYLPARSPEFNPDEKVWHYLKNEEMKSHQAKNKAELKILTKNKLSKMSNKPHLLRGLFMRCEIAEFFV